MFTVISILLFALHTSNSVEMLAKQINFEDQKLVLSDLSFNNETFVYAMCDHPMKKCTVVRESSDNKDNTCELNLNTDDVQDVVVFGKDKVILVALQSIKKSMLLKTITVHMSNCKTIEEDLFEIPFNWMHHSLSRKFIDVVVFDGGFELIVKRHSKICTKPDPNKYCAFGFDEEGKSTGGPYIWPRMDYYGINVVLPILTDASGKGYFFVHENVSIMGVQVDRKGGPTVVNFWGPLNVSSEFVKGDMSVSNNVNGACFALDSSIKCWQNDAEGGLKIKTEFTIKHQHEIWNIYIHNLREGGFMILAITCRDRICMGLDDHYYLLKIDARGKVTKTIELDMKKSECDVRQGSILARIHEARPLVYCPVILCRSYQRHEDVFNIVTGCYTDYNLIV